MTSGGLEGAQRRKRRQVVVHRMRNSKSGLRNSRLRIDATTVI
jgi:hypothetical protein